MTTLHSFKDEAGLCFANVRLDNGTPCFVSVAQTGVLAKKSRLGLLGKKLYRERSHEKVAMTAAALDYLFPDRKIPECMSNPVLCAFTNAVLHCPTADDVETMLGEAILVAQLKSGGPIRDLPNLR